MAQGLSLAIRRRASLKAGPYTLRHSATSRSSAVIVVISRERLHLEGARTIRIDERGVADAILPHQRRKTRDERRHLLGRRVRAREQRVLQHAPRRRIDEDGDLFDRRRRRMRFEIEQDERPERPDVAYRRGELEAACVRAGTGDSHRKGR